MIQSLKEIKFNRAQFTSIAHPVLTKAELWGRGSGKTTGLAYESKQLAHEMPGASFVIGGPTYANLEGVSLPGLVAAWKKLGFYEGIHFELNKKPDKRKMWPEPFVPPITYDHFIPWYTGAGFYITSQDKETPFRGPSIDGVFVDEALLINKEKFDAEIVPTNRGRRFNHPLHHFYRFYSTKPRMTSQNWLYNYSNYYNQDLIKSYRALQKLIAQMTLELLSSSDRSRQEKLFNEIRALKKKIRWFPDKKNRMFYSEFDFWDNIPNISIADVRTMEENMSSINFRIEVLNETMEDIEGGFYSTFNEDKHVKHDTFNYSHIDYLTSENRQVQDCRWHNDIMPGLPLRVALDWGGVINTLICWQRIDMRVSINNHLWAEHPLKISDLAKAFVAYYQYHPTKHVMMWYDHTGNNRQANSTKTNAQEFAQYLKDAGWTVTLMTKGGAPTHEWKYYRCQAVLGEEEKRYPIVRINANRCSNLITAMRLTPIKRTNNAIEKDKSSERDVNFPQHQATHATDCFDIIIKAETEAGSRHEFRDVLL